MGHLCPQFLPRIPPLTSVVRACIFQAAVASTISLEGWLARRAAASEGQLNYDAARAARGFESLIKIGAEIQWVVPKDRHARLRTMVLSAHALEGKINALGGRWERFVPKEGPPVLAIVPPENPSEDWQELEPLLLRLKWKKQELVTEEGQRLAIVTCTDATYLSADTWYKKNIFKYQFGKRLFSARS